MTVEQLSPDKYSGLKYVQCLQGHLQYVVQLGRSFKRLPKGINIDLQNNYFPLPQFEQEAGVSSEYF